MEIDLKHLGQILVIGAFAVYAILFLARICHAPWLSHFLPARRAESQLSETVVYLAIVFSVGVVIKDVSKSIVAQRDALEPHANEYVARFTHLINSLINIYILDTDDELRFRSLIDMRDRETPNKAKLICLELRTLPKPPAAFQPYFEELTKDIDPCGEVKIAAKDKSALKSLRRAINQIYYEAKNRDYREQTYYEELSDISDKLDFTRSLTLLFLLFFVLYFLFFCFSWIPLAIRFFKNASSPPRTVLSSVKQPLKIDVAKRLVVLFLAVVYAACIWIAAFAYRGEATDYDLRVFGYYISLVNGDRCLQCPLF